MKHKNYLSNIQLPNLQDAIWSFPLNTWVFVDSVDLQSAQIAISTGKMSCFVSLHLTAKARRSWSSSAEIWRGKGFRCGEGDPIEGDSCWATKDHKLLHDMYIYDMIWYGYS